MISNAGLPLTCSSLEFVKLLNFDIFTPGGKLDNTTVPVDGFDVWDTISIGKPSPRKEILLNIDLKPEENNRIGSDPFYQGAAIRVADMKLLMSCPNSTWFKPPELHNDYNDGVSEIYAKPHMISLSIALLYLKQLHVAPTFIHHFAKDLLKIKRRK